MQNEQAAPRKTYSGQYCAFIFLRMECFSYNITARMWHNIHINNSCICFLDVTKQIQHTEEKMCYFILTPSSNESLNSHCRNINLSDKLHFQYWQAGTKMWKYPSQLLCTSTGFYTLSNKILAAICEFWDQSMYIIWQVLLSILLPMWKE